MIDFFLECSAYRAAEGGLAPSSAETGGDGEIVGGPRTPQQIAAQRRLQQTQAQVDEVIFFRLIFLYCLNKCVLKLWYCIEGCGHYENECRKSAREGSKIIRTWR